VTIEILINVAPRESRAAMLENGVLQELHIERASHRGLVSNLYKGRVSRVLPGMQAAFVEIGLERTGFLHAADIAGGGGTDATPGVPPAAPPVPEDIRRLLNCGDEILVQVLKDPLGSKGARLTTFITLPSRYLVYLPRGSGVGVSTRIEDEPERTRLKDLVAQWLTPGVAGGYIVRTAAHGAAEASLREDMAYLAKLWEHVRARAAQAAPGSIVHEDLPLSLRVLRDELGRGVGRVLIDSPGEHARMQEFAATFMPGAVPLIELYSGARPILDLNGIEEEIARALERKVPLKSGGHDHHRREHRCLCRSPQPRGNHPAHQPRGGGRHRAPTAAAQSRWHHHHRLHRYARRVAPAGRARGARACARRRPGPVPHRVAFAARARGNDPQAHPRESRASAVPALSKLHRARSGAQCRNRV
jgi:ribonuclease G